MYKILVIGDFIQNVQDKNDVKYINVDSASNELRMSNYDLVYLSPKFKTEKIERHILADYMKLPKILEKLAINGEIDDTYVDLKLINKLIIKNLETLEFKDYFEEITISNIIKQMLIFKEKSLKDICIKICPDEFIENKVRGVIKETIGRNYVRNNIIRKIKYRLCHNKVEKNFFKNILVNVKDDIDKMEEL